MTLNIIPVQGTFDIARGRNVLRMHMAANHWSPGQGIRVGALLTAIGRLIMNAQLSYTIPIEVSITSDRREKIWMRCTVPLDYVTPERFSALIECIQRTSDHTDVMRQPNQVSIVAHLFPDGAKEV